LIGAQPASQAITTGRNDRGKWDLLIEKSVDLPHNIARPLLFSVKVSLPIFNDLWMLQLFAICSSKMAERSGNKWKTRKEKSL